MLAALFKVSYICCFLRFLIPYNMNIQLRKTQYKLYQTSNLQLQSPH